MPSIELKRRFPAEKSNCWPLGAAVGILEGRASRFERKAAILVAPGYKLALVATFSGGVLEGLWPHSCR